MKNPQAFIHLKIFSDIVYTMGDHEGTLQIEYDDFSMKTETVSKRFGGTFGTLRFVEKSFLDISGGLKPFWDYNPTNALHVDSPGVNISKKKYKFSYNG